jgi:homoserine O-acetyltransferase
MTFTITQQRNGTYYYRNSAGFHFKHGGRIDELALTYTTYGNLSAAKDNVVVIHHALSTNSHVRSHAKNTTRGWWENMVGPGCPIDTQRYYVICINNLGSCFGSSGPASINPNTQQAYACDFPQLSIDDIAHAQYLLLQDLGITRVHALVGPSMGGMISLSWAWQFPHSVNYLVSISSCMRSFPSNIALRSLQREIIRLDPAWQQGHYQSTTKLAGFLLARKLAHLSYRNCSELDEKYLELSAHDKQSRNIKTYLAHNAQKFISNFDANSYLYLTKAMDKFDLTQGEHNKNQILAKLQTKTLIISVNSDTLFHPRQQQELYHALTQAGIDAQFIEHTSAYGHDTFLVETDAMGQYISDFIAD